MKAFDPLKTKMAYPVLCLCPSSTDNWTKKRLMSPVSTAAGTGSVVHFFPLTTLVRCQVLTNLVKLMILLERPGQERKIIATLMEMVTLKCILSQWCIC